MVRIALTCLLASLAGPASADIPGVRWTSPAQPWRVATSATAVAVVGKDALVGGFDGWIGRIDLATGQVLHSTRIDLEIYQLTALHDGRVLVTGKRADRDTASVLDPLTLSATPISLPEHWRLSEPVALAEGVVFAGSDIPLALYDPITWKVRRILDTAIGWSSPVVSRGAVLATHEEQVFRFEWTGKHTVVGRGDKVVAGGDAVARRVIDDITANRMGVEVDYRGKPAFTISQRFVNHMAIDPAGTRLTVYDSDGGLEVFALPSGKSLYRPRLGHGNVAELAVAGSRVVLAAGRVVRVLDGRDGSLTSTGGGPVDQPWSLTVDNAGAVAWSTRDHLFSFTGGTITSTLDLGGDTPFSPPRGEIARFAGGDNHLVAISTIADRSVRSWKLEASMSGGWFDRDRMVVETTENGTVRKLVRGDQHGLSTVVAFEAGGVVHDVDLRTDRALVSFDGTLYQVSLRDGHRSVPISAPGCTSFRAQLEPGGRRLSVFDDHQIGVWDGSTVFSTRFGDEIYRVEHVPNRDELVIALRHGTVLWSPRARTLRELPLAGVTGLAVSPDGHRIAFALPETRAAVADLDVLRSSISNTETRAYEPAPPRCRVARFAAVTE